MGGTQRGAINKGLLLGVIVSGRHFIARLLSIQSGP
jgi:hypothetical protein